LKTYENQVVEYLNNCTAQTTAMSFPKDTMSLVHLDVFLKANNLPYEVTALKILELTTIFEFKRIE
jgi:hypothetical protein